MSVEISVIVCTYNRAELLQGCLKSLVNQTCDRSLYEILIVNNNSTDKTQAIAEEFCCKEPNFRTVIETNQGLSFARNRGAAETQGNYVAFIDDDAEANPNWLNELYAFTQRHPEAAAFGGPCELFSYVEIPDWFPQYGGVDLGGVDRAIDIEKEGLIGANLTFKREILEKLGGFDQNLGMSANKVSYGEEIKLLLSIKNHGFPIFYAHKMKVKHFVSKDKMSLGWLLKANYFNGLCSAATLNRKRKFYSHIYGLLRSLLIIPFTLLYPQNMPFKKRIYLSLYGFFWEAGTLLEYLKNLRLKNSI